MDYAGQSENGDSRGQNVNVRGREQRGAFGDGRGVASGEAPEGETTRAIEQFTSQVPSGTFLTFAIGSIAASALLFFSGRKEEANFIGQWVPTILIMGLYNKLVKLEGSDRNFGQSKRMVNA